MRVWHSEIIHTPHGWQRMPINGTVTRTFATGARLIKWDTGRGAVYQSNDRGIRTGEFPILMSPGRCECPENEYHDGECGRWAIAGNPECHCH